MSTNTLLPELIALHEIPSLIPSTRPGKKLNLSTLYRWVVSGRLPSVKIAGGRYVRKDDLFRFVNGPTAKPPQVPRSERARAASAELERLLRKPK